MFNKHVTVVSIASTIIKVTKVSIETAESVKILEQEQYQWTPETLAAVFKQIKDRYGTVRLQLSEEYAYITHVKIEGALRNEREEVKKQAQELIPENLEQTIWDFKAVLHTASTSTHGEEKVVQVVAVVRTFLEMFSTAVQQSHLHIEAIEPLSYSNAYRFREQPDPVILIDNYLIPTGTVMYKGIVVATKILPQPFDVTAIDELQSFCQSSFNLRPTIIFVTKADLIPDKAVYESKGYRIEQKDIHPAAGLALKKDLQGKDENILNLELRQYKNIASPVPPPAPPQNTGDTKPTVPIAPMSQPEVKKTSAIGSRFMYVVAGGIILIFIIIIGVWWWKNQEVRSPLGTQTSVKSPIEVTLTPRQTTVEPTVSLSTYGIQVLNGTEKAGEATRIQDILTLKQFKVVAIGNADESTYEATLLKVKKNVSKEYIAALDKVLSSLYSDIKRDTLAENASVDIVLIIGKK